MAKLQIEKQKNNDINITLGGGVLRLSNEPLSTYPVGTIIETTSEVSPAQLYGGTWEEFGQGKVLVGRDTSDSDFNTILKTGGEKQHTLSVNEMPSHSHYTGLAYMTSDGASNQATWWAGGEGYKTHSTGGSQAHNNLQPYIVVYRWRRIA